jgi:alpha-D-xyloside xylohydrolase
MGPFIEYTTQKPADPIELRIYPRADGSFTLYEDENDNYNYEKGIYATIDFIWDDSKKTLTISDRKGEFPGMLQERTFNIVIVGENNGTGIDISKPLKTIEYVGTQITQKFKYND